MPDSESSILQGTLDLMVLKTLEHLGPLHGYGIARRIEQIGERALIVNQGTVYLCLVRLVQKKWITAEWGVSDNNRKAKFYSLTMAAHLEMAEEEGRRRGLTVEEARRAARVELGGVTQLRESWRAAWGLSWLDGFALDAKLGLRMLRRSWGLTLAGGLAMTIVITIAAVVFVFLDEFMGRTA